MSTARSVSRAERRRLRLRLAAAGLALMAASLTEAEAQQAVGPLPPLPPGCAVELARPGPAPVPALPTPPPLGPAEEAGLGRWRRWRHQRRREHQAKWIGYPEEFNEWPLGRSLYANMNAQVDNAAAARLAFYDYDFVPGTDRLNLRGQDKLARVAAELPASAAPIVVERTPDAPGLDRSRRLTVLNGLGAGPWPLPPSRVVVGPPPTRGLRGVESVLIGGNQLNQTAAGGASAVGAAPVAGGALDATGLTGSAVSPGLR